MKSLCLVCFAVGMAAMGLVWWASSPVACQPNGPKAAEQSAQLLDDGVVVLPDGRRFKWANSFGWPENPKKWVEIKSGWTAVCPSADYAMREIIK